LLLHDSWLENNLCFFVKAWQSYFYIGYLIIVTFPIIEPL
jgi:hypothetical protein